MAVVRISHPYNIYLLYELAAASCCASERMEREVRIGKIDLAIFIISL